MLFTENYIFLSYPKTGSTYVRHVIKSAGVHLGRRIAIVPSCVRPKNVYFEQLSEAENRNGRSQHGKRSQIDEAPGFELGMLGAPMLDGWYKRRLQSWKNSEKRQIVSIWRDPVERVVSAFNFQFWAEWPDDRVLEAKSVFPNFPDLTFAQYYELNQPDDILKHFPSSNGDLLGIGRHSWKFIRFFASKSLLDRLKHTWPSNADEFLELILSDTQDIKFLDHRFLSKELAELMKDSAFNLSQSSMEERVNVTPKNRHFVSSYEITEKDLEYIRSEEDFLYQYWEKRSVASEEPSMK